LKTERLRSLEVDDQLEFCRLHDRSGWLLWFPARSFITASEVEIARCEI
jgi:hypothetical protein